MPPKPRPAEVIASERARIIQNALEVMSETDYAGFTMRKLAAKMQMSPTNIYQYFVNKDEIYLHILTSGFDLLREKMLEAVAAFSDPVEKYEASLRSIVSFALNHYNYYYLMYCTSAPKPMDYVGTPLQALAVHEKAVSFKLKDVHEKVMQACLPWEDYNSVALFSTQLRSCLHGALHYCHTGLLGEMDFPAERFVEQVLQQQMDTLRARIAEHRPPVDSHVG